jgi:hypothetical protein
VLTGHTARVVILKETFQPLCGEST